MNDLTSWERSDDGSPPCNEFLQGWRPLLAAAMGLGLGLSPLPAFTIGVFSGPLVKEFHWSRASVMGSAIFTTLAILLLGPWVGRLADRIGARPIALVSVAAMGVGMAALSLTPKEIWVFYAIYTAMSVLALGTTPIVLTKTVSLWFERQRGFALGIALCTTGVSGMLLPIYVQTLIAHVGWRGAYVGVGILPLIIALPCIWLFLPAGTSSPKQVRSTISLEGMTLAQAAQGYRLWVIGLTALAGGAGLGGVLLSLVPLFIDKGLPPAQAASVSGLYGLFVVLGRLLSGWLMDRFWAPAVGCVFMLAPTAASMILIAGHTPAMMVLAAAMMGLASGGEFDLIAYLTGRYFGQRHFSTIYGVCYACFAVGSGFAPVVFGLVHDRAGSYIPALYGTAALFGGSAVVLLTLGRYPRPKAGGGDELGVGDMDIEAADV